MKRKRLTFFYRGAESYKHIYSLSNTTLKYEAVKSTDPNPGFCMPECLAGYIFFGSDHSNA